MFIYNLGDVIGVLLVLIFGLAFSVQAVKTAWRQRRCAHERVRETTACDAICCECGKNLGFIGTWHEKQRGKR